MSKVQKKFDAVALMRAARDRISAEIEGMTLAEELRWLASQELHDPFLKRLRQACEVGDMGDKSVGDMGDKRPG